MSKERRKHKKRKLKKGFTLIELLAVIIILGVLMIIAIPSVTEYISSSRKNAYITTVQRYVDATTTKVNGLEYDVTNTEITYYIPTSCISLEKGGTSPFGDFEESYVVVTYDGYGYDYYYTGRDSANHGVVLTYRELLDSEYIDTTMKEIDLTVGVGNRENIIMYSTNCNANDFEEIPAKSVIKEQDTLKNGAEKINVSTATNCFEFNSSTGTITDYKCSIGNPNSIYEMIDVDKCVNYLLDYGFTDSSDEIKMYCEGNPNFESSIIKDINNGIVPTDVITEMLNQNIIKLSSIDSEEQDYKNVIIPKKINGVTVRAIGEAAFAETDIYTIEIPETVTTIAEAAFANNSLLYNIINKTGKAFDWGEIVDCGYSSYNNTFETGMTNLNCGCGRIYQLNVTSSKPDYDLSGIFQHTSTSLMLVDTKGYDIYYKLGCNNDNWIKYEINQTFNCDTEFYAYNILEEKNYTTAKMNTKYIKNYSVQPLACDCPNMEIKIEKNGQLYFAQHFDFSCR